MKPSLASLSALPPDSLLALIGLFRDDPAPDKIDLGVGVYRDATGQTPIFQAVQAAHMRFGEMEKSKAYLGPMGWPGFAEAARDLILGSGGNVPAVDRVVCVPTPGGCGALRLSGEVIRRAVPTTAVWMSDPTWANHKPTFGACGLSIENYPYLDRDTGAVRFDAMMDTLNKSTKAGDIILLHGCCHNPTGADMSLDQWHSLTDLIVSQGLIPLIDIAYHGLGDGLDADLAGARYLLASVEEALVCYSFSKNMGLYRDRVGAILYMGQGAQQARIIHSHILDAARQMYSMPPTYGEALAGIVLTDDQLRTNWMDELEQMRQRVLSLRAGAAAALVEATGNPSLAAIGTHRGMFSILPLSPEQVAALRKDHAIYCAPDGRINICGLGEAAMPKFAAAVAQVQD